MCGIAGVYGFRRDNLIDRFSKELFHRGPDGEGRYVDDNVSLLNRRLAIIDIKGGNQPIYNENKSVIVTYNGEIYNYLELREKLIMKGHCFRTNSDTEVIVHGYEEWGDSCFDRFNGMFGIALYDKKDKRLVLARDHFGIKPLYYAVISDKPASLIFSSEIKPILSSGLLKVKPNEKIIFRYLRDRIHDDTPETFFRGIFRLLPGELMLVRPSGIEKKQYSNLETELISMQTKTYGDKEAFSLFRTRFEQSVRLRLISEVPVGTCLSGGLDSSSVVTMVNQLLSSHVKESKSLGSRQKTFSAVFPKSSNDEEL